MSLHRWHRRRKPAPSSDEPADSSVTGSIIGAEPSSSTAPSAGGSCQSSAPKAPPPTHAPLPLLVRGPSESESVTGLLSTLRKTWSPSGDGSHASGELML